MCRCLPDNICIDLAVQDLCNQYSLLYTHIKMGGLHYITLSIIVNGAQAHIIKCESNQRFISLFYKMMASVFKVVKTMRGCRDLYLYSIK